MRRSGVCVKMNEGRRCARARRRGPLWAASGGVGPCMQAGNSSRVSSLKPEPWSAPNWARRVGLVVPGSVGARGVVLRVAWGHVLTGVLVVCACE